MDAAQILNVLAQGSQIVGAILAIIGGLKVLARYTNSDHDDKVLDAIERPFRVIADLLNKGDK